MTINPDAVGTASPETIRSWTIADSLLYAVGVGAGQSPTDKNELAFVTENSSGVVQRAIPTMAVILPELSGAFANIGSFNPAMLVHGSQRVVAHRELPTAGEVRSSTEISAIWDKGKSAVIETISRAVDVSDGEPLFDLMSSVVIRGEGGWGGERGPGGGRNEAPERGPDHAIEMQTRPEQALVYRLSGDRNPLHSDPRFAAMAGFDRPILHGLCTYGFAGRALLHALCESDPARFHSIEARFSSPVTPGERLTTNIWVLGSGEAAFKVLGADGRVVIDAGSFNFAP